MAVTLDTKVFLRSIGSEQFYKDALEQAGNFNMRMSIERKQRLPFIDSHTGVAQNHSDLFQPYRYRHPGKGFGQLYSYPSKRWKKKKRSFFACDIDVARSSDIETGEADMHQISAVENPAHTARVEDFYDEKLDSQDQWYDDPDLAELQDVGKVMDDQSDISDFEDQLKGRKKKKKETVKGTRGRKKIEKDPNAEDKEKPYVCEACGARYKTRPGLAYHYTHFHNGLMDEEVTTATSPKPPPRASRSKQERGETANSKPAPSTFTSTSTSTTVAAAAAVAAAVTPTLAMSPATTPVASPGGAGVGAGSGTGSGPSSVVDPKISANNYCDFCLGDSAENKKTRQAEDLVSCSDCGRAGHPSCLQFTDNMIISVKKYPWQCIECKSCGLCGTSDNDDQLLFCDDCDRGYHMYCLNPPLTEPPEGNWSCHLCIEEFHGGKKPQGMN